MKFTFATVILCFLSVAVEHVRSARILAMTPSPAYSHQLPFRSLFRELSKRGHEVVLVTSSPDPKANYTQINVEVSYLSMNRIDFVRRRFEHSHWMTFIQDDILLLSEIVMKNIFEHPQMQKLYAPGSSSTFDLVMIELFYTPASYAFAHRFNAPLIGLLPLKITACNEYILGGLMLPSHESTWEMGAHIEPNMSFWTRLRNFFILSRTISFCHNSLFPAHQAIAEKYLGRGIPPLLDIVKNVSLVFENHDEILSPARLKLPNVITFSSFHISKNPPPLSKDLKRFLDDATGGFIYFSLGTVANSSNLPSETIQIFVDVFAKLPCRVLWKYEDELPGKSDNVYTATWFPQQSVLAHPNVKLFLYQGGLQSSQEAVHFMVPVIGFPVLADQDSIVTRMEDLGIGKRLDLVTLTRKQLESAILEMLTNEKYKEKIRRVTNVFKEKPRDLIRQLVWWTEYVIRHRGAPYFRSSLIDQPWYQQYDMDIIVFLAIVAYTMAWILIAKLGRFLISVYGLGELADTNRKEKAS